MLEHTYIHTYKLLFMWVSSIKTAAAAVVVVVIIIIIIVVVVVVLVVIIIVVVVVVVVVVVIIVHICYNYRCCSTFRQLPQWDRSHFSGRRGLHWH